MARRLTTLLAAPALLGILLVAPAAAPAQAADSRGFVLDETTVSKIHEAFARGTLTCAELVDRYLARINAYENQGPAINALITVAPDAMAQARALDREFRRSHGRVGPLHCIP